MRTGAAQPEIYLPLLQGKKIGVIANATSLMPDHTHLVDFLLKKNIRVQKIFAPEHGFRGTADAGEKISDSRDAKTGLPIISLYGKHQKPTAEDLQDIDVLLFDIQDVGVRFYTYISTLALTMEAAAENSKKIIVLDRPNLNDGVVDGPVLQKNLASFVGMHPVPILYGLSIGEYAEMLNAEGWLKDGIKADLQMVPLKNYHKKYFYDLPVPPSPNLPNTASILLYPSLCLFEGTQVSVGRGTDFPYQQFGAPELKNYAYHFIPAPNGGAKIPFRQGEICFGKKLTQEKKEKKFSLKYILEAFQNFKGPKENFFLKNNFFDKLAGNDVLRASILAGKPEKEIRRSWEKDLDNFKKIRARYVRYPD